MSEEEKGAISRRRCREIMTKNVKTGHSSMSLCEIAALMRSGDMGAVPIVDDGKLIGIVTDRDIVVRGLADGKDASCAVKDVMTEGIVYCQEDTDVDTVAEVMKTRQIRRIVVLDGEKRLCGIVSLGDLAIQGGSDQQSGKVLEKISEAPPSPRQ